MSRTLTITAVALAITGCSTGSPRPVTVGTTPPPIATVGLERVMGQDQPTLIRLLGRPDAEIREGTARKLQFASAICVLDAYLYPRGSQAPRVTWIDARQPDGTAIDRASCVAALARRPEAR